VLTIGINPTGKRPDQAVVQPDPSNRIAVGKKEEAKIKVSASDGAFHGNGQPYQFGHDRGHVRVGPVVLVRRQAIALIEGRHDPSISIR
jgi:hypothetical protein